MLSNSLRQFILLLCRQIKGGLVCFVNFVPSHRIAMIKIFSSSINRLVMLLCTATLLLTNGTVFGQKEWALQECVNYALQHNLNVKQSYLNTNQAANQVLHNKLALAPTVSGSAGSSYNWGRSVDPFTYQFTNEEIRSVNLSLNGNASLFNGFELQNTLRQSKLDYLASQSDLKKIENDISLNVVSEYLQVLFAKEQLKIYDNRVAESGKQRDRTKIMYDAGNMTRGNLLDAESQLATEELNKITAENQFTTATLNLVQLLELDSTKDFQVQEPKVDISSIEILSQSSEGIYQKAIAHLPEIQSVDLKVNSAEKGLSIAKGGLYPRLSMYGSYSSGYSSAAQNLLGKPTPFKDQLNNNLARSLGLSLNVPIFSGWSAHTSINRAKITVLNAQLNADITRNQVFKSIQQAYTDAVSAQKKYYATQKSEEALQEANLYADKRFNAGLSSSLEFLTATNNLTKAKTELLQAKYDYIFKLKILDFYAGNPLTF